MPVTVSFNIDNEEDRAAVRDMLTIYEPDRIDCCDDHLATTVCVDGLQPDKLFKGVDIVEGLKTLHAEIAGHSNVVQFTATLPGDDGSEECDDAPIDPAAVGFGQSIHSDQFGTPDVVVGDVPVVGADGVVLGNVPTAPTVTEPATSTVTPISAPASAGLLDSRGFPWDARIHASSKSINQDGTYRYKKGLNPVVKEQVEAALRGGPVVAAMPGNVPAAPIAIDNAAAGASPTTVTTVSAPPPPPPPVAAALALTFAKVITQMSVARWDKAAMDANLGKHGVTMATLAQSPHLWPTVYAEAGGQ